MILASYNTPAPLHPWLDELNDLLAIYERVMDLKRRREALRWWRRPSAWAYVVYGYTRDVWFNVTVAADIFRDPARELTLTARLKRYRKTPLVTPADRERAALAEFLCDQVLDKGDPDGNHC